MLRFPLSTPKPSFPFSSRVNRRWSIPHHRERNLHCNAFQRAQHRRPPAIFTQDLFNMDGYDWQMLLFGDAAAEVMRVICRCEEGHYHVRTADYVVMISERLHPATRITPSRRLQPGRIIQLNYGERSQLNSESRLLHGPQSPQAAILGAAVKAIRQYKEKLLGSGFSALNMFIVTASEYLIHAVHYLPLICKYRDYEYLRDARSGAVYHIPSIEHLQWEIEDAREEYGLNVSFWYVPRDQFEDGIGGFGENESVSSDEGFTGLDTDSSSLDLWWSSEDGSESSAFAYGVYEPPHTV